MAAVLEKQAIITLDDMIKRLGSIPLDRIRACPPPGTAVEQDVIDLHDHENRLFELVEGILVEKPMGFLESMIAAYLIEVIGPFVRSKKLGVVAAPDGMMRIGRGLVRTPDVSVVLWERLPGRRAPREPIPSLAPDLAVEVLSKSNTPAEMDLKIAEYFAAGTLCVWIVDAESASVRVYSSPTNFELLTGECAVTAETVLPGFSITVAEIFENSGVA